MKTKRRISGYFIRSTAIAVLFCSITLAFISGFHSANGKSRLSPQSMLPVATTQIGMQAKALTFADRVAYQRAIEEVYWRHRIWPQERSGPKPSLDEIMPREQLQRKVKDYLRESQALEHDRQQPITAEQLQAEMDRMAQHTKNPEMLREVFQALGNNPFVIAECFARPVLAERSLTGFRAPDERFPGKTSGDIEPERQAYLEHGFDLATVELRKRPFGPRKSSAHNQHEKLRQLAVTSYRLPPIPYASTTCSDVWIATSTINAPTGRIYHTAVWTGSEMIVWGGYNGSNVLNTGGRYNPATDSWTATSITNAPVGRELHTAVWTGTEMIVWGGRDFNANDFNSGGRYNPATNSWIAISTSNAPTGRYNHTAVWTGNEMIIWGGYHDFSTWFNTGGRYNPTTDSWTATSTTNAPTGREVHTAVWTGNEMIVWGGTGSGPSYFNTGARYNPSTDNWTATNTTNAPTGRDSHTAVWTGSEMIVWGGNDGSNDVNTGGRYNPGTDSWTAISTTNAPTARVLHTAVWPCSEMIIWGGTHATSFLNTGGIYDPSTDTWTTTGTTSAPSGRYFHTAVWSGTEMIVWGGAAPSGLTNTGGRYCAQASNYTFTTTDVPGAAQTIAAGINSLSHIVGSDAFPDGSRHGFLDIGGAFTAIDDPNATTGTGASDINGSDQIVGSYDFTDPGHPFEGAHGFLLIGGMFTGINYPAQGVTSTTPNGINNSGDVVGLYRINNGPGNGFLYSGGNYTPIDFPSACCTHCAGINDAGQIVGQYKTPDANAPPQGFLKTGDTWTTIDYPCAAVTSLASINNFGDIVGAAENLNGAAFGFVYRAGNFSTVNFPGAATTIPSRINDDGVIVGLYQNSDGIFHGFEAVPVGATPTPTPTPTSTAPVTPTPTPSATVSPTATPLPTPTGTPPGCVLTHGYWRNHPNQWPVIQLQLGNRTYNRQELQSILEQPPRGNGLVLLAREEIAAKLNIATGANGSCIQQTLADVDALIADLIVPPVGTDFLTPTVHQRTLAVYNAGALCAPHCQLSPQPTPTGYPTPRPRATARPRP